jgi:prepilin-type N-terminal cleavage/methylation domain-containing protein
MKIHDRMWGMASKARWYPVSTAGKIVTVAYTCVPASLVYFQYAGYFPDFLRAPITAALATIFVVAGACKVTDYKLFSKHKKAALDSGFTLLELLMVISIIGILATMILPIASAYKAKAYMARAKAEMRTIATALEQYANDHGGAYPPDASRDLPAGLAPYLGSGDWPKAPWPGSVYDWDNWGPSDLAYPPQQQTYQISVRFCTTPESCNFPNESWAAGFDYYSSVYLCLSGSCRSHSSQPVTHPGLCVNCSN